MLADGQDHQKAEHRQRLRPVRPLVPGGQLVWRKSRKCPGDRIARKGERSLVRDPRIDWCHEREAEAVEQQIGDHDRRDQRQDHQRFAIALEPGRLLHQPPPERIADRGKHRKLDEILEGREHPAR